MVAHSQISVSWRRVWHHFTPDLKLIRKILSFMIVPHVNTPKKLCTNTTSCGEPMSVGGARGARTTHTWHRFTPKFELVSKSRSFTTALHVPTGKKSRTIITTTRAPTDFGVARGANFTSPRW